MRYFASLNHKGLTNCQMSKIKVWKKSSVGALEPWFTKQKGVWVRPQKIFYQTSNFDIWQFVSSLRYKDVQHLILKIYKFSTA